MEALLNFQTLVADLTGMEIANASLLDEGTALAEALALAKNANEKKDQAKKFFVDTDVFPQTLDVLKTRSEAWGWEMEIGDCKSFKGGGNYFAVILQYPSSDGSVKNRESFLKEMKEDNCFSIVAADLLSLTLLKSSRGDGSGYYSRLFSKFGNPFIFWRASCGLFCHKERVYSFYPREDCRSFKRQAGKSGL